MNLNELVQSAKDYSQRTIAVAVAEDEEVLSAVLEAVEHGLGKFLLFGDREKINQLLREKGPTFVKHDDIKVIHSNSKEKSAELAVKAVHSQDADILMKGNLHSSTLLKAVLNKDYGLRTGKVLSHIAVFEVQGYDRLIFVTDAGMNISPTLEQKVEIVANAVSIARALGVHMPKVAPLAALETINPSMSATVDGAILTQMNKRGQIKDCIVDGPLALDNAVSLSAAKQKGIESEVAGEADILLVPSIEVGNSLYKSLIYFAGAKVGAVVAGAKVPIVLTSRSDSAESKLYSLALAVCCSKK
ncbi:phosphate butyryltransferase [Litchfieldia salsa]|uniref:Phosphate butyryltransferase n=1 Tax=Litchfieldia salsa TaxID=930152 RepID=A0A1H0WI96_9BACI|nr:phosphate butyryltransferase [Litchfieldia salsa]SDP90357.1 phosphate butyryltransferase [Litchfieldia salsa]